MSEIEVPEELDDDEAEKILQQRARARSGSKKSKGQADDDSGRGGFLIALLALVLWGLSELGITFL